tara:strand:- start:1707 stop:4208 length:2502 start_codon:yes stop_codon:yes gene_type:complete
VLEIETWMLVYVVTGLLATAVLFVPLSQKIKVPYTVILAALGLLMGAIGQVFQLDGADPLQSWLKGATSLTLSSEIILFLFLPVLVFEAALSLDARRLMNEMGVVLVLAVLGLVLSTVIVGMVMSAYTGVALMTCLLLGAICSATDPVAVVGVFKEVGAPTRLATLVEGESLFNDATALVLFAIISGLMIEGLPFEPISAAMGFLKVFVGGVIVGLFTAFIFGHIIDQIKNSPLVNHALSVALAYFSFIFAEHFLHVSGVMAVVSAGLYFGATSDRILNLREIHALHEGWEQLGFWANSIIFVVMGIVIASFMVDMDQAMIAALLVLIATATAARFLIVFGLLGVFERLGLIGPVSGAYKAVMTWGGLRGAVSLALALIVLENTQFAEDDKRFIVVLVSLFVLSTLFVNATTISVLMRWLKLDRLSNVDEVLRVGALLEIRNTTAALRNQNLSQQATAATVDLEPSAEGLSLDAPSGDELTLNDHELPEVTAQEWTTLGLSVLMGLERRQYKQLLDQDAIDGQLFGRLVQFVEDSLDALRHEGLPGLEAQSHTETDFGADFKIAVWCHRHLGVARFLEHRLGRRFELLSAKKLALEAVTAMKTPVLFRSMGEVQADAVHQVIAQRLAGIRKNLNALSAQFPDYCAALEQRMQNLNLVNLELETLGRLASALMVSEDVAIKLRGPLDTKKQQVGLMPALEISLSTKDLILKVPLFAALTADQAEALAQQVAPVVFLPGEMVCEAGEMGQSMYFIGSGAVEVLLDQGPVLLGTGEFFGELALITESPRVANVHAAGFCELLALERSEFESFLAAFPEVRSSVMAAARLRTQGPSE